MWVAIHKYIESMLGISLYSYLYPKLTKKLIFSLQQNRRGLNRFCLEAGGWGVGGVGDKVEQTKYRHVSKCKSDQIKGEKKN
jgi:hypothetical protein